MRADLVSAVGFLIFSCRTTAAAGSALGARLIREARSSSASGHCSRFPRPHHELDGAASRARWLVTRSPKRTSCSHVHPHPLLRPRPDRLPKPLMSRVFGIWSPNKLRSGERGSRNGPRLIEYPGLYAAADAASLRAQRSHFRVIRLQLGLFFLAPSLPGWPRSFPAAFDQSLPLLPLSSLQWQSLRVDWPIGTVRAGLVHLPGHCRVGQIDKFGST